MKEGSACRCEGRLAAPRFIEREGHEKRRKEEGWADRAKGKGGLRLGFVYFLFFFSFSKPKQI